MRSVQGQNVITLGAYSNARDLLSALTEALDPVDPEFERAKLKAIA